MKKSISLSICLCLSMLFSYLTLIPFGMEAKAVSKSQMDQDNVFVKQETDYTCTLAANTNLLRRAALLRGDSDWDTITQSSCRSSLWMEGAGMYYSYTYRGIHVDSAYLYGSASQVIELLKQHPEGIVIYDHDFPHAILVTDYTDGVFYGSDSSWYSPIGRAPVSQLLISVESAESYWYVTNALPKLSDTTPLTNTSTISTTSAMTGQPVKLRPSCSGGKSGYQYACYIQKPGASQWETISGYSSVEEVTYTPRAAGSYKLKVVARDSAGKTAEKSFSLTVRQDDLVNSSTVDKTSVLLGDSLTLRGAGAKGSCYYKYEYYVKVPGAEQWKTLLSVSRQQSYTYTPDKVGSYQFKVIVSDYYDGRVEKLFTVSVNQIKPLANLSSVSKTELILGETVELKASAADGSGVYSHSLVLTDPSQKEEVFTPEADGDVLCYVPKETGYYRIKSIVKDSAGATAERILNFHVEQNDLSNQSSISGDELLIHDTLTLTGSASGGVGSYQYEFLVFDETIKNYRCIQEFSSVKTCTYPLSEVGTYSLMIRVKDSVGKIKPKRFTVEVKNGELVNKTSLSSSHIGLGETITIDGAAIGGSGSYQFEYYYKKATSAYYQPAATGNGISCSAVIKPGACADYMIKSVVTDSSNQKRIRYYSVTVTKEKLVNESSISANTIYLGDTIRLTSSAAGGSGSYEYASGMLRSTTELKPLTGAVYSRTATAEYRPGSVGLYFISSGVKDSDGTVAVKTFTVNVLKALTNCSTVSNDSILLGEKLTVQCKAEGGAMPYRYQIQIKKPGSDSWSCVKAYSSTDTYQFTPGTKGEYTVMVNAKDSREVVSCQILHVTVR